MSTAKRSEQEESVPLWGRPKTTVKSSGVQLDTQTNGFFVEDLTYRHKKRRTAVHWRPTQGVPDGDECPENPSLDCSGHCLNSTDTVYHDLADLDVNIQYDPGYTSHERERKVCTSMYQLYNTPGTHF